MEGYREMTAMKTHKTLSMFCFVFIFLMLYSCSTGEYTISPQQIEMKGSKTAPYRIQSLDVIMIEFPLTEKHSQQVTVRPDGSIILDVAGEVKAAGLTPHELAESIKKRSSRRLRNPEVEVTIVESSQKVFVGGEVESEGIVYYREGLTVLQAIFERGGFRNTAETNNILLIRAGKEKEEIRMNIKKLKMENIAAFIVSPNDVIYVPKTGVAKAGVAMQQFIRDMLPIEPAYSIP